jgi:hypothetical protein
VVKSTVLTRLFVIEGSEQCFNKKAESATICNEKAGNATICNDLQRKSRICRKVSESCRICNEVTQSGPKCSLFKFKKIGLRGGGVVCGCMCSGWLASVSACGMVEHSAEVSLLGSQPRNLVLLRADESALFWSSGTATNCTALTD